MKKTNVQYGPYKICSRREMLELIGKSGAGIAAAAVGLKALDFFCPDLTAAETPPFHEAMYYEKLSGGRVRCLLCPRQTVIPKNRRCHCKTRRNIEGKLYAAGFNKPCIVNFDPVERGPLYHFMPGTDTMALGAAGCNLNCIYCQNYELAQRPPEKVRDIKLDTETAIRKSKVKSLTLTYTDPACQPEYIISLSRTAKKFKLPVILCTAAYIKPEPLREITKHVDAFAVTLKAASNESYRKLTGVEMDPVLKALEIIKTSGKWLEVVTLIVPGYNDDRQGIEKMAGWIRRKLGPDVPWHLSRFTPNYKLRTLPPTPRRTLEEARQIGLDKGINYVYITNLAPHAGNNSYCPKCHKKIIGRLGFKMLEKHVRNGKCCFCGTPIPGTWT